MALFGSMDFLVEVSLDLKKCLIYQKAIYINKRKLNPTINGNMRIYL